MKESERERERERERGRERERESEGAAFHLARFIVADGHTESNAPWD